MAHRVSRLYAEAPGWQGQAALKGGQAVKLNVLLLFL